MTFKFLSSLAASAALLATPIAASAEPVNPAASLSVAPARASSPSAHHSNLAGGAAIYALIIVAGIAAIVAVGVSNDKDLPRSN